MTITSGRCSTMRPRTATSPRPRRASQETEACSRSRASNSSSDFVGLLSPMLPDGDRIVGFLVAPDDDVRDLLDLGVADPLAHRLVRVVDLDAELAQLLGERLRRLAVVEPDRDHAHLHRREPDRERAAVVLDQDPDEALERAVERPVDDVQVVLACCPRRRTSARSATASASRAGSSPSATSGRARRP